MHRLIDMLFKPIFTISKLKQEKIAVFFNFDRVSLYCPGRVITKQSFGEFFSIELKALNRNVVHFRRERQTMSFPLKRESRFLSRFFGPPLSRG